jgi:hypothetical protein
MIQYNVYYTFGLQTATSWTRENATGNNFLGNGGTELNQTSSLYPSTGFISATSSLPGIREVGMQNLFRNATMLTNTPRYALMACLDCEQQTQGSGPFGFQDNSIFRLVDGRVR